MILHNIAKTNKKKKHSIECSTRGESKTGQIVQNRTTKRQQMISERVSDHMKENIIADYSEVSPSISLLGVTDEKKVIRVAFSDK